MRNETKLKIVVVLLLAFVVAATVAGLWGGRRFRLFQTIIENRNHTIERLTGELISAQAAIGEAETTRQYLRTIITGIRAERDTLVEKFGIIRNAVEGIRAGTIEGEDIIDESLRILNLVINSLDYLEGVRIWE